MRPGGITAGALANVAPLDQQRAVEYFGSAAGGASGSLPRPFGLPPCAVVSLSLVALLGALSLPLRSGLVCGLAELGRMHVWFADAIEEEPALRLTERLPWLVADSLLGVGREGHALLGKVLVLHVLCPPSRVASKGVEVLLPREDVAAADDGAAEGDGCRAADGWQATEEDSKKEKPARHPAVRTQLPKPPNRRTAAELRRRRHSERLVGEAFLLLLTATRPHRDLPRRAVLAAGRHLRPVWSTVVRRCAATGSTRRARKLGRTTLRPLYIGSIGLIYSDGDR